MCVYSSVITVAILSPKTSAKYCGISVTIVAKTQDLAKLVKNNVQTGGDVSIPFQGMRLACIKIY
jgi:hypothetical protein